jgi:hypothetical protein
MNNQIKQQEQAAIHYIDTHIINPYQQAQTSEISAQNYFFSEVVLNYLKNQALNYVGQALVHCRKQAINKLVDLSDWLLEQLEDYLVEKYKQADREEREIFKNKIQSTFPHSRLLEKLTHE